MPALIEVRVLEMRRHKPFWGPRRLALELAKKGVTPTPSAKTASQILRHANVRTTLDIYTHISPEQKRTAVNLLSCLLVIPGNLASPLAQVTDNDVYEGIRALGFCG
jgi:hypothetical protein